MYNIGDVVLSEQYDSANDFCRDSGDRHIEWINDAYYIVKNLSEKEILSMNLRAQRDAYLNAITWRVERYREQVEMGDKTTDSADIYSKLLQYRKYLRDIPQQNDFPDVILMTFDEWNGSNEG